MVNIPIVDSHAFDHIDVKGLRLFDRLASEVNVVEPFARTAHLLHGPGLFARRPLK